MNISEGVPERTPFLFYTTLPPISLPERTVELSGIFLPVINVRNSRLISGIAEDSQPYPGYLMVSYDHYTENHDCL